MVATGNPKRACCCHVTLWVEKCVSMDTRRSGGHVMSTFLLFVRVFFILSLHERDSYSIPEFQELKTWANERKNAFGGMLLEPLGRILHLIIP
ncbi:hypothetical protein CDAR_420441 [Caerostris darwini]|uniref:Uncharacterized protein n=1 Tax=Caerostris darwini TaxID=1538125 RepID=A0AAV4TPU9_9ARAC|nr:hypothetical protein CDAR_420441 [Caerostris darwini]